MSAPAASTMQAVVLAGGVARRLGSRAHAVPKYLQPVAGRPFAHWQLERLAAAGFTQVLLCIGHLGERIVSALGSGERFGLTIGFAFDGATLLGTGGALRAALDKLEPTFLLTYGDSLLPFDYAAPLADLRAHPEALGTMAVYRNRGRYDASNTQVVGDQVQHYDPQRAEQIDCDCIDYGATALRREAVAGLEAGPSDLGALQAELAARGRLRALMVSQRFYQIGSPEGLDELDRLIRSAAGPLSTDPRTP